MSTSPRTHYLCCIPVEGAVTALGYFQASASVLGFLAAFRSVLLLFKDYLNLSAHKNYFSFLDLEDIQGHIIKVSYWKLGLGLCLTVAIFLIVGVKTRRPGYVLSYFIVGVMMAVAGAVYWLVRVSTEQYFTKYGAIEIFLALFVYSLCLPMVYFVYRNIKLENPSDSGSTLYETLQENRDEGFVKEEAQMRDYLWRRGAPTSCCTIPVDALSLALGCFQANAAIVLIVDILSFCVLVLYTQAIGDYGFGKPFEWLYVLWTVLMLWIAIMCLGMAIVLIYGITKRDLGCVRSYLRFGGVVAAAMVNAWIRVMRLGPSNFFDNTPLSLFALLLLYLLWLLMVFFSYENMRLEKVSNNAH